MGDETNKPAAGAEEPSTTPKKTYSLDDALGEMKTFIEGFATRPQAVTILSLRFSDAVGEEIFMTVGLHRPAMSPAISVDLTRTPELSEAAEDFRVFHKDGVEALVARLKARQESAADSGQAEETPGEETEGIITRIG